MKPRARMIPRHVRIKKLPARHKQSQVSESSRAGRRRAGKPAKRRALEREEAEAVAKRMGGPSPSQAQGL